MKTDDPAGRELRGLLRIGNGSYLGRNNHQTVVMSVRKPEDEKISRIILQYQF